jgi:hypothetical protein
LQVVWQYQPDLVALTFCRACDIAKNVRALNDAVEPDRSP